MNNTKLRKPLGSGISSLCHLGVSRKGKILCHDPTAGKLCTRSTSLSIIMWIFKINNKKPGHYNVWQQMDWYTRFTFHLITIHDQFLGWWAIKYWVKRVHTSVIIIFFSLNEIHYSLISETFWIQSKSENYNQSTVFFFFL